MKQYGMTSRPFNIGCQPVGAKVIPNNYGKKYYNVIECHELTSKEIYKYELEDIQATQIWAEKVKELTPEVMKVYDLDEAEAIQVLNTCKEEILQGKTVKQLGE